LITQLASVQVLDFYLDDERKNERLEILNLAKKDDVQSTDMLRGYVREAMRKCIVYSDIFRDDADASQKGLNPQFTTILREAAVDAVIPQGPGLPPMQVKAGEHIGSCFKNAHLNVCFIALQV
jgi:hypothetical protein